MVRDALWGDGAPRFTGHIAYRFLVDADTARPFMGMGRSALWLGPQRTFNRYTVRGGAVVNCVGLSATATWTGRWLVDSGQSRRGDGDLLGLSSRCHRADSARRNH